MHAGREDLNQRRGAAVDRIRHLKHVACGNGDVFGKAAVGVTPDQHAVRTQMGLSDPTMETGAAIELRVDDNSVARSEMPAALDHLADHLMAHDSRIGDRNRAAVDLQIGAADAAVGDANEHVAGIHPRPRHIVQHQLPRCPQDHGSHHGVLKLSVVAALQDSPGCEVHVR